jgi:CO/xanthine dehydrogenase FAD-binding subunit
MADELQLVHVKIPRQMYAEIQRIKKAQNKTASAVIREALAAHIEGQSGAVVSHEVSVGGYRPRKEKPDEKPTRVNIMGQWFNRS